MALASCSSSGHIGTREQPLKKQPQIIVWYQIAGFSSEHLPLIKYDNSQQEYAKSIENFQCLGQLWSYNFYEIRPSVRARMASQLSGDPDVRDRCEDLKGNFIWDYATQVGYKTILLENESHQEATFEKYLSCENFPGTKPTLIKMTAAKDAVSTFHFQDTKSQIAPGVNYDKSCNEKSCFSGWQNNIKALISKNLSNSEKSFIIFQDTTFLQALKSKKILEAKDFLIELTNNLKWIYELPNKEILVLISGTNSLPIEFPDKGKTWAEYQKSGANIIYHRESLVSPIYAWGASSENFCGVYGEEDILRRIFWSPDDSIFSLSKLNKIFN